MKFTNISLKMMSKKSSNKSKSSETIKCLIKDGVMVTRYSNPDKSFQAYMGLKKQYGKNGYEVAYARGVITEWFKDKKRKEIAESAKKQFEALRSKMGEDIVYKLTEEEIEK